MNIAVISDTHLHDVIPWFESIFDRYLKNADVLIHCGDTASASFMHWLDAMHPRLEAVLGNMDPFSLRDTLPSAKSIILEGFRIGMAHGWGPRHIVPQTVRKAFSDDHDIICFGHIHHYVWQEIDGVMMLNPGSLQQDSPSFAMLTLEAGKQLEVRQIIPE